MFYFIKKIDEKEPIKSQRVKKITKIKLQMNEHEIYIHVNNNSRVETAHPEFTT